MTLQFQTTDDTIEFINILVYGEAGVGKTHMIRTAPDPLIISAEGGLLSLKGTGLPVLEIATRSDIDEIYDYLMMSSEAKAKYKTICLDSLSEVAEVLLSDEKKRTKYIPTAYGVMADEMLITTRGFKKLPYHVYFTAKNKKTTEESTGIITSRPSVPGQAFLNEMPYQFDIVAKLDYFMHDGAKHRGLFTSGDRTFVAKDRSGSLSNPEQPDLTRIFQKILPTQSEKPSKTIQKVIKDAVTTTKSKPR